MFLDSWPILDLCFALRLAQLNHAAAGAIEFLVTFGERLTPRPIGSPSQALNKLWFSEPGFSGILFPLAGDGWGKCVLTRQRRLAALPRENVPAQNLVFPLFNMISDPRRPQIVRNRVGAPSHGFVVAYVWGVRSPTASSSSTRSSGIILI